MLRATSNALDLKKSVDRTLWMFKGCPLTHTIDENQARGTRIECKAELKTG